MTKKHEIAQWWAENPMTYGKEHGTTTYEESDGETTIDFNSREFFERADQEMFGWNTPLHDGTGKFGKVFPYQRYQGKDVLEIGCGMGGMSMLWAQAGANITSCDINPVAIEQTTHRFALYHLKGRVQREDANALSFGDRCFDYVYSWGVLHHSPNLEQSVKELFRVLKPGGEFGVMLYNRQSLAYWWMTVLLEGFLHGELRFLNALELASRYGDADKKEGNPHTWPVTRSEVHALFSQFSPNVKTRVLGTEMDSCFFLFPGLYRLIPKFMLKPWARRFGWSIWISGSKA
jgi:ubiquinone/menaquinone biosynthesis C-methylase UbiE